MSFPNGNYSCVGDRPATTVGERQHSLNWVVRARAAHYSKNISDESRTGEPNFMEDFLLEHSSLGQQTD